jgi:hypothetical protein
LVPDGSVHGLLADHRRELVPDELFADLFGSDRGRPWVPADQVATVMVLQVAGDRNPASNVLYTDRQLMEPIGTVRQADPGMSPRLDRRPGIALDAAVVPPQ